VGLVTALLEASSLRFRVCHRHRQVPLGRVRREHSSADETNVQTPEGWAHEVQALRLAMLHLLNGPAEFGRDSRWRWPRYWAALLVVGSNTRLPGVSVRVNTGPCEDPAGKKQKKKKPKNNVTIKMKRGAGEAEEAEREEEREREREREVY